MTTRLGTFARAAAITLTAGLAFGLAGCGDDAPSGPGYASTDSKVQTGDAALTRDTLISTAYDAAMKAGSAHMVMKMSGTSSVSAQGDVTYDGADSAMQMSMAMPQLGKGTMQMRYVGKIMYMTIPGVTPEGKFLKIDPNDPSSPMARGFAGLTDQMDPLASVKTMQSSVTGVNRVGQEQVDGVSVDHYRVTVDTSAMRKKLGKAADQAHLPTSVTYDMWLDAKNLIRKMTFDISGSAVEIQLSKWGEDVKVERPDAGEIIKAPAAQAG